MLIVSKLYLHHRSRQPMLAKKSNKQKTKSTTIYAEIELRLHFKNCLF